MVTTGDAYHQQQAQNAHPQHHLHPLARAHVPGASQVVIDLGSRVTRAGFVSAAFPDPEGPRICVPSVAGGGAHGDGEQQGQHQDSLDASYPIRRGYIEDMDGVEEILREVLCGRAGWPSNASTSTALGSSTIAQFPASSPPPSVLVVEPSMQSRKTRERLMEVIFERFGVVNYFSMDAAVASLYSIGKASGIVVDVGYDKVDVTPVLEGVVHAGSAARLGGFGGHAMTEMIGRRHGLGYAAAEARKVGGTGVREEGEEDGKLATLEALCGEEIRDRISEIGSACINASMVSLVAGEREWRKALMEQVFVCGGGSRVAGFGSRVAADVVSKQSSGFKPFFLSVPEYMPAGHAVGCASWYGGHATAGVVMNPAVVQKHCVTKELYEEHGARALWRRVT